LIGVKEYVRFCESLHHDQSRDPAYPDGPFHSGSLHIYLNC
jgi:hypothetical protein